MAVPKRKTSKSKRGMRRSHHALKLVNIAYDEITGEPRFSHTMSKDGGYYRSRQVIVTKYSKRQQKLIEDSKSDQ